MPLLITRRERWSLTWLGRLLLLILAAVAALGWVAYGYTLLAVSSRQETNVLVVEGWIHDFAIEGAAEEFRSGRYKQVLVTGGPISGTGGYTNDYNTSASVGADRLKQTAVPADVIQMVPSRVVERDRTYGSAIALREWFHSNNVQPRAINVVTEGPHARRTRQLFQKAFGDETTVGVIAISNPDYEGARWWRYSEGVKDVVTETLAYLYSTFLFHPGEEDESSRREKANASKS